MIRSALVLVAVMSSVWPGSLSAKVPQKAEVVIIGAGLSGLAAAYELKKAGVSYHILELTPRVGGRVRTVRYEFQGQPRLYSDSGMEEYWESNPAVKLLRELKLPVRHDIAASSMVLGKKLEETAPNEDSLKFEKRIFSADEFSALERIKAKAAPIVKVLSPEKPIPAELIGLKDISFAKWVQDQGAPQRVADWIRISVECEIGTEWDKISALDGIAEFHIFLGKGEESYRVLGGNERFTDALAKAVGSENISVNKKVNRVVNKGQWIHITYLDTATNDEREVLAKHVVSTIPLYRISEVQFQPALSDKKRQAIASQSWGAYFKAHVFVPAKASRFWEKNGNSLTPILSDSELGVIYEGNPDQKTGTKILSLLITGRIAEAFNMTPLDNVRTALKAGFDRLWPGFSKEIQSIEFYRLHPRAIAAWPVGRSRYDDLSRELRMPENRVYLAGDFTESSHSDGAFISASRVVRQILEARKHPLVVPKLQDDPSTAQQRLGVRSNEASRVSGVKKKAPKVPHSPGAYQ
jgi:monoamine oxidase